MRGSVTANKGEYKATFYFVRKANTFQQELRIEKVSWVLPVKRCAEFTAIKLTKGDYRNGTEYIVLLLRRCAALMASNVSGRSAIST